MYKNFRKHEYFEQILNFLIDVPKPTQILRKNDEISKKIREIL